MNAATEPQDKNTIDGQITEVKAVDHALAVLKPEEYATQLFQPFQDRLAAGKRRATREKYDITTKDGMAKAKELKGLFVKIRTEADEKKAEAKRPIDESGKKILEHFRKVEEAAKAEEKKHADAIAAEEKRLADEKQRKLDEERERVERLQTKVDFIRRVPDLARGASSQGIADLIEELQKRDITKTEFEDHFEDAVIARDESVTKLRGLFDQAVLDEENARRIEAERAELERLRAEQAERDRIAAEEAAERERVAQAERDKAAAEKAELERQLAEMRAQMAAMQPKPEVAAVEPAPAVQAHPVEAAEPLPATVESLVDDIQPYDVGATTCDDRAPIQVSDEPAAPLMQRPTDGEIIEHLATYYGASEDTVTRWLVDLVKGLDA